MSELIPITFKKIMQSRSYTVLILGTNGKNFAIYTEPQVGLAIQLHLTEKHKSRPYTHDLINKIFEGFTIKVLQVVITDVQDTIYFAKLFLELAIGETKEILEIDTRPSDSLILALMNHIPLFCKKEVLESAIAIEV